MTFNFRYLRPTGNKIKLSGSHIDKELFKGFEVNYFQSGTAALSAAIIACHSQNKITKPEVILPAYACPDLISAVLHANATPILIDLEADTPWVSLNEFEKNINENTLAIIAINFLGISERTKELKSICEKRNVFLIEDSAQGLPQSDHMNYWNGDIIIISFGRGKPLNLLGGGATLVKHNKKLSETVQHLTPVKTSLKERILFNFKIFIYNALINPFLYNLVTKIPSINLGQTVYKKLTSIKPITDVTLSKIHSNLISYNKIKQENNILSRELNAIDQLQIIDLKELAIMNTPLLRHPFLIKDKDSKDTMLISNLKYGLSDMYKVPLNKVSGLEGILDGEISYPNAETFAKNLVTFPTHSDFNPSIISRIIGNYQKDKSI